MAIVSEFEQGFANDKETVPSDQTETSQQIVKRINDLLQRSKRHRKRYDSDWHFNYEFVCAARQWPIDRPRWRFSEVVNLTWAAVMTEIAIQTDQRPKFEYESEEWGDQAFTDVLKEVNARNWDKYKWHQTVVDCLFDCKLYHVAHAEVGWDPDLEEGMGDVFFRVLDPYYCYWDPRAWDVNKSRKARWFIYAEPIPTAELKIKHPSFADKIKSDVSMVNARADWSANTPGRVYINFDPYTPSRLPSSATATGELFGGEPHTVLIRCWMRDDAMEELVKETEEVDPATGEKAKEYLLLKKYPKGRYIEMANNQLLRDSAPGVDINGKWTEYDFDEFPVARLVNYQYPREYAGENEVTHLKGPAKIQNYIWSYILDCFKLQGNPITVIGDAASVDEEEVTGEPGAIIHAADISQIRREQGLPVTPGSMELLSQSMQLADKVQGLQDVSRGAQTPNVNSALMMEGYVEAAQTRPRMKNRNLDLFLQDSGELMLRFMLQFYDQPRVFRITNKEGYPASVEFYMPQIEDGVDDMGAPILKKVAKVKTISTGPNGQPQVGPQQQMDVKGLPDVRVISGSALPYAKAQKNQSAIQLFNSHLIDQEEALKAMDWPNYETVLKRMAQAAQQAAEAQAQQAQGQKK
jgi:hypothetical protein